MKTPALKISLLVSVCSFFSGAQAQTITTIAGIYDSTSYNGDTIAATAVHLYKPDNIILDNAGNYYIADTYHGRIRKVDASGIITTIAGIGTTMGGGFSGDGGPATAAQLNSPLGMAFDHIGNLYVADNFNNRIRKISTDGIITTIAGTDIAGYNGDNIPATAAQLNSPHYIAFDAAENLYICDYSNSRIRKIDGAGIITTIAGTGLATGGLGEGGPATLATIPTPYGIAIDADGSIFFSDDIANLVRKINTAGIITTMAGTGHSNYNGDNIPATSAWLFNPCGIDLDNAGNIYIADGNNRRVRKINHSGIITTIAGNGSGYSGDGGLATDAGLGPITGVTISSSGDMYIAGYASDVIRLVRHAVDVPRLAAQAAAIDIFPNPNNGTFILQVSALECESVKLLITDVMGKVVYRWEGITNQPYNIKLQQPAGIYLISLNTPHGEIAKKMIIE